MSTKPTGKGSKSKKNQKEQDQAQETDTSQPLVRLAPAATGINEISHEIVMSPDFLETPILSDDPTDFKRTAYNALKQHEGTLKETTTVLDFGDFDDDDDDDGFGSWGSGGGVAGFYSAWFGGMSASSNSKKDREKVFEDEATLEEMTRQKTRHIFRLLKDVEECHANVVEATLEAKQKEEELIEAARQEQIAQKYKIWEQEQQEKAEVRAKQWEERKAANPDKTEDELLAELDEDEEEFDEDDLDEIVVELDQEIVAELNQKKAKLEELLKNYADLPQDDRDLVDEYRTKLAERFEKNRAKVGGRKQTIKEAAYDLTSTAPKEPQKAITTTQMIMEGLDEQVSSDSEEEVPLDENDVLNVLNKTLLNIQKEQQESQNVKRPDPMDDVELPALEDTPMIKLLEEQAKKLSKLPQIDENGKVIKPTAANGTLDDEDSDDMPDLDGDDEFDDMPSLDDDTILPGDQLNLRSGSKSQKKDEIIDWLHNIASSDSTEPTTVQLQREEQELMLKQMNEEFLRTKDEGEQKKTLPPPSNPTQDEANSHLYIDGKSEIENGEWDHSTGATIWDFRTNSIPAGCHIVGSASFYRERDNSTYLQLDPGSYLELNHGFSAYELGNLRFTLTMDVLFDKLPEQTITVSTMDNKKPGCIELIMHRDGGITFNGGEPAQVQIKPTIWSRVTLGVDMNKSRRNDFGFVSVINHKVSLMSKDQNHHLCEQGPMKDKIFLFGSAKSAMMNRTVKIRTVSMQATMVDPRNSKVADFSGVYSKWESELDYHQHKIYQSLSLASLYQRPPPAWNHPFLRSILVEHSIDEDDVHTVPASSLYLYSLLLTQTAETQIDMFPQILPPQSNELGTDFSKSQRSSTNSNMAYCSSIFESLATTFMDCTAMSKAHPSFSRASNGSSFVKKIVTIIEALSLNESALIPMIVRHSIEPLNPHDDVEVGQFPVFFVVELTSHTTVSITLINTSLLNGVKYQGISGAAQQTGYGLHFKPCVTYHNIPLSHVTDYSTWYVVHESVFTGGGSTRFKKLDQLYYKILPILFGVGWDEVLEQQQIREKEYAQLQLMLAEQSLNGTTGEQKVTPNMLRKYADCEFYGVLGHGGVTQLLLITTEFLMKRLGIPAPKPLLLALKLRILDMYYNDLSFINVVNPSEVHIINAGLRGVAQYATQCVDQAHNSHGVELTYKMDKVNKMEGRQQDESIVTKSSKSILTSRQLFILYRALGRIRKELSTQKLTSFSHVTQQTLLLDDSGYSKDQQHALFPHAEKFILNTELETFLDDSSNQGLVSFDILDLPQRITTYRELIYVLRKAKDIVISLRVQRQQVKRSNLLARSFLFYIFSTLIPIPLSPYSPTRLAILEKKRRMKERERKNKLAKDGSQPADKSLENGELSSEEIEDIAVFSILEQECEDCFYFSPMTYSQQQDLLALLSQLMRVMLVLYLSEISVPERQESPGTLAYSEYLLNGTTEAGNVYAAYTYIQRAYETQVISGVIFTIMDFISHKPPSDQRSVLVDTMLEGHYGFHLGDFILATQGLLIAHPEYAILRAKVIEYFTLTQPHYKQPLLNLSNDQLGPQFTSLYTTLQILSGTTKSSLGLDVVNLEKSPIFFRFPELRNILLIAAVFRSLQIKPSTWYNYVSHENRTSQSPTWESIMYINMFTISQNTNGCTFQVSNISLPSIRTSKSVYISAANPEYIMNDFLFALHYKKKNSAVAFQPVTIKTEDCILHQKTLPTFGNTISQQESEQLLSALTVPYLRIPLITSFFAEGDRAHTFRNPILRQLFLAVLFEQGNIIPFHKASFLPEQVPTDDTELIGTHYGLLLNELIHNPSLLIDNLIKMFKSALELEVGTVHSTNTHIILFIIRILAQIENYVNWILDFNEGKIKLYKPHTLIGLTLTAKQYQTLLAERLKLSHVTQKQVLPKLHSWESQLFLEIHLKMKGYEYAYHTAQRHLVEARNVLNSHDEVHGNETTADVERRLQQEYDEDHAQNEDEYYSDDEERREARKNMPKANVDIVQYHRSKKFDVFQDLEVRARQEQYQKGSLTTYRRRANRYASAAKNDDEKKSLYSYNASGAEYEFEDVRIRTTRLLQRKKASVPTLADDSTNNAQRTLTAVSHEVGPEGANDSYEYKTSAGEGELLTNTIHFSCSIHAHVLLILRNVRDGEMTPQIVSNMLSSVMYLTTHYPFDYNMIIKNEHIYEIVHRHRRTFITVIDNLRQEALNKFCEKIVKVSTCITPLNVQQLIIYLYQQLTANPTLSGNMQPTADDLPEDNALTPQIKVLAENDRQWNHALSGHLSPLPPTSDNSDLAVITPGARLHNALNNNKDSQEVHTIREFGLLPGSRGRYVNLMEPIQLSHQEYLNYYGKIPIDIYNRNLECEINVQTLNITIRNSQMENIPQTIRDSETYHAVLGRKSMHGALIESNSHLEFWRVIGTGLNITHYREKALKLLPDLHTSRQYSPNDLHASETWLLPVFEAFRLTYLDDPFNPVLIFLPETPTPGADCIILQVCQPRDLIPCLEIRVYRTRKVIHVFEYIVYNLRIFLRQVYSSNAYQSFADLYVSAHPRRNMFQPWERHQTEGFDVPAGPIPIFTTISRDTSEVENLSGSVEVFIPASLLSGIFPDLLLSSYNFWQDTSGNLRGYPMTLTTPSSPPENFKSYIIYAQLITLDRVDTINRAGTTFHITRVPIELMKKRLQRKTMLLAQMAGGKLSMLQEQQLLSMHSLQSMESSTVDQATIDLYNNDATSTAADDAKAEENINSTIIIPHVLADSRAHLNEHKSLNAVAEDGLIIPDSDNTLIPSELELLASERSVLDPNTLMPRGSETAANKKNTKKKQKVDTNTVYELVNLMHAPQGSATFQISRVLNRLEYLASILPWKKYLGEDNISLNSATRIPHHHDDYFALAEAEPNSMVKFASDYFGDDFDPEGPVDPSLDPDAPLEVQNGAKIRQMISEKVINYELIELPTVSTSFHTRFDHKNQLQLYSLDHNDLYVSNIRTAQLTDLVKHIPHGLLLQTSNDQMSVFVPLFHIDRIRIMSAPYSTEFVVHHGSVLDEAPFVIYPVHTSHSFLFLPTLTSALYLLYIRMLSRDYDASVRLLDSISTDVPFSGDQKMIYQQFSQCAIDLYNPDALATMLRLSLTTHQAVKRQPWSVPKLAMLYSGYGLNNFTASNTRLLPHEELQTLRMILSDDVLHHIEPLLAKANMHYAIGVVALYNRFSYLTSLIYSLPSYRVMVPPVPYIPTYYNADVIKVEDYVVWYIEQLKTYPKLDELPSFTVLDPNALLIQQRRQLQQQKEQELNNGGRFYRHPARVQQDKQKAQQLEEERKKAQEEEEQLADCMFSVNPPQSDPQLEINSLIPLHLRTKLPQKSKVKQIFNEKFTQQHAFVTKLTGYSTQEAIQAFFNECLLSSRGYGFLLCYMLLTGDTSCKLHGNKNNAFKLGQHLSKLLCDFNHRSPLNYILRLLSSKPELAPLFPRFSEYKQRLLEIERQKAQEKMNTRQKQEELKKLQQEQKQSTKSSWGGGSSGSSNLRSVSRTQVDLRGFVLIISRLIVRLWVLNPEFVTFERRRMIPLVKYASNIPMQLPTPALTQFDNIGVSNPAITTIQSIINREPVAPKLTDTDANMRLSVDFHLLLGKDEKSDAETTPTTLVHLRALLTDILKHEEKEQEQAFKSTPITTIEQLQHQPVSSIELDKFFQEVTRKDKGLPPVSEILPFNINSHPESQTTIAKMMTTRLEKDIKIYANQANKTNDYLFNKLYKKEEIEKMFHKPGGEEMIDAIKSLRLLGDAIIELRSNDIKFISLGQKAVLALVNNVGLPNEYQNLVNKMYPIRYSCFSVSNLPRSPDSVQTMGPEHEEFGYLRATYNTDFDNIDENKEPQDDFYNPEICDYEDDAEVTARLYYLLGREAKRETTMWFEYVVGSLLSSRSKFDLLKLNPFIPEEYLALIFAMSECVLLRTNRIAQLNRTLQEIVDIQSILLKHRATAFAHGPKQLLSTTNALVTQKHSDVFVQQLIQKSQTLIKMMCAQRYYYKPLSVDQYNDIQHTMAMDEKVQRAWKLSLGHKKLTKAEKIAFKQHKIALPSNTSTPFAHKSGIHAVGHQSSSLILKNLQNASNVLVTEQISKILDTSISNQDMQLFKLHVAEKSSSLASEQTKNLNKSTDRHFRKDFRIMRQVSKDSLTKSMLYDPLEETTAHVLKAFCPLRDRVGFLLRASQKRTKAFISQNFERIKAGQNVNLASKTTDDDGKQDTSVNHDNLLWDIVHDTPEFVPGIFKQAKQGRYGISRYGRTGLSTSMFDAVKENLQVDQGQNDSGAEIDANEMVKHLAVFDPRYLVFEFTWSLLLRKSQVEMVDDFVVQVQAGNSLVRQLLMGSGKTYVIAPLCALMLTTSLENSTAEALSSQTSTKTNAQKSVAGLQQDKLIVSVVPPALLELSRSVMRSTFSSVIFKKVVTFTFERATTPTFDILSKLKQAARERSIVISTPNSLKSVLLKLLETQQSIANPHVSVREPEAETHLHILTEILHLFRRSICLMDEVDMILNPLKSELNYPFGEKLPLDFSPSRWSLALHIIDCILYYDDNVIPQAYQQSKRAHAILKNLREVIDYGFSLKYLLDTPHLVLLNEEFYFSHMKPHVVDWTLLFLDSQHVVYPHDKIRKFFDCTTVDLDVERNPAIQPLVDEINQLPTHHIKLLMLAKEWVRSYLPHVLQKISRIQYGLLSPQDLVIALAQDPYMPPTRSKLAIPFTSLNSPSVASEFSHSDIVIGLTYLAFKKEGLRYTDFVDILSTLRESMMKELGVYSQRPSNIRYNEWVQTAGGVVLGSKTQLKEITFERNSALNVLFHDAEQRIQDLESKSKLFTGGQSQGHSAMDHTKALVHGNFGQTDGHSINGNELLENPAFLNTHSATQQQQQQQQQVEEYDEEGNLIVQNAKAQCTEIVSLRLLKQTNHQQMDALYNLWKNHSPVIQWYLDNLIFPTYLRTQNVKLSASGVDLGSDLIFSRRIGFSGTPSDLLPIDLGACQYEAGSDGEILTTLTNPDVVGTISVEDGWTVRSILDFIANARTEDGDMKYSALIDVAALVTGFSNEEVAHYLLTHGLEDFVDGVVFIDREDRKMVLNKTNFTVSPLEQSGISPTRRFAFYDQQHTTGMDIGHRISAKAVVTLGPHMVFRDWAQGAYRMRGIAQGQTLDVLITPQIRALISRVLAPVEIPHNPSASKLTAQSLILHNSATSNAASQTSTRILSTDELLQTVLLHPLSKIIESRQITDPQRIAQMCELTRINAFLVINAQMVERTQFCQLTIQNVTNVWKKEAFKSLLHRSTSYFTFTRFPSYAEVLQRRRVLKLQKVTEDLTQAKFIESITHYLEKDKYRHYDRKMKEYEAVTKKNQRLATRKEKQNELFRYFDTCISLYTVYLSAQLERIAEYDDPRDFSAKIMKELRTFLKEQRKEQQKVQETIDQSKKLPKKRGQLDDEADEYYNNGDDDDDRDQIEEEHFFGVNKHTKRDSEFEHLMTVFHEIVDLTVPGTISPFVSFYNGVKQRIDDNVHLLASNPVLIQKCYSVLDQLATTARDAEEYSLGSELVQILEDEKTKQLEDVKQKEVEIEKYAEIVYDRSFEEQISWPFDILAKPIDEQVQFYHSNEFGIIHLATTSSSTTMTLTPAMMSELDVDNVAFGTSDLAQSLKQISNNRLTMKFPQPLYLSQNYYNNLFTATARRLKNVTMYLDLIPSLANLIPFASTARNTAFSTRDLFSDSQNDEIQKFSHELSIVLKMVILLGLCTNSGLTGHIYSKYTDLAALLNADWSKLQLTIENVNNLVYLLTMKTNQYPLDPLQDSLSKFIHNAQVQQQQAQPYSNKFLSSSVPGSTFASNSRIDVSTPDHNPIADIDVSSYPQIHPQIDSELHLDFSTVFAPYLDAATNTITAQQFLTIFTSHLLYPAEANRYTVVVSLAEAETIRRIVHVRLEMALQQYLFDRQKELRRQIGTTLSTKATTTTTTTTTVTTTPSKAKTGNNFIVGPEVINNTIIDNADAAFALRCMSFGGVSFATTSEYKQPTYYQFNAMQQLLRFINNDTQFTDAQIHLLVSMLDGNHVAPIFMSSLKDKTDKEKEEIKSIDTLSQFYTSLLAARRRYQSRWIETPVKTVLCSLHRFDLMKNVVIGKFLNTITHHFDIPSYDLFTWMDLNLDTCITPPEFYAILFYIMSTLWKKHHPSASTSPRLLAPEATSKTADPFEYVPPQNDTELYNAFNKLLTHQDIIEIYFSVLPVSSVVTSLITQSQKVSDSSHVNVSKGNNQAKVFDLSQQSFSLTYKYFSQLLKFNDEEELEDDVEPTPKKHDALLVQQALELTASGTGLTSPLPINTLELMEGLEPLDHDEFQHVLSTINSQGQYAPLIQKTVRALDLGNKRVLLDGETEADGEESKEQGPAAPPQQQQQQEEEEDKPAVVDSESSDEEPVEELVESKPAEVSEAKPVEPKSLSVDGESTEEDEDDDIDDEDAEDDDIDDEDAEEDDIDDEEDIDLLEDEDLDDESDYSSSDSESSKADPTVRSKSTAKGPPPPPVDPAAAAEAAKAEVRKRILSHYKSIRYNSKYPIYYDHEYHATVFNFTTETLPPGVELIGSGRFVKSDTGLDEDNYWQIDPFSSLVFTPPVYAHQYCLPSHLFDETTTSTPPTPAQATQTPVDAEKALKEAKEAEEKEKEKAIHPIMVDGKPFIRPDYYNNFLLSGANRATGNRSLMAEIMMPIPQPDAHSENVNVPLYQPKPQSMIGMELLYELAVAKGTLKTEIYKYLNNIEINEDSLVEPGQAEDAIDDALYNGYLFYDLYHQRQAKEAAKPAAEQDKDATRDQVVTDDTEAQSDSSTQVNEPEIPDDIYIPETPPSQWPLALNRSIAYIHSLTERLNALYIEHERIRKLVGDAVAKDPAFVKTLEEKWNYSTVIKQYLSTEQSLLGDEISTTFNLIPRGCQFDKQTQTSASYRWNPSGWNVLTFCNQGQLASGAVVPVESMESVNNKPFTPPETTNRGWDYQYTLLSTNQLFSMSLSADQSLLNSKFSLFGNANVSMCRSGAKVRRVVMTEYTHITPQTDKLMFFKAELEKRHLDDLNSILDEMLEGKHPDPQDGPAATTPDAKEKDSASKDSVQSSNSEDPAPRQEREEVLKQARAQLEAEREVRTKLEIKERSRFIQQQEIIPQQIIRRPSPTKRRAKYEYEEEFDLFG